MFLTHLLFQCLKKKKKKKLLISYYVCVILKTFLCYKTYNKKYIIFNVNHYKLLTKRGKLLYEKKEVDYIK